MLESRPIDWPHLRNVKPERHLVLRRHHRHLARPLKQRRVGLRHRPHTRSLQQRRMCLCHLPPTRHWKQRMAPPRHPPPMQTALLSASYACAAWCGLRRPWLCHVATCTITIVSPSMQRSRAVPGTRHARCVALGDQQCRRQGSQMMSQRLVPQRGSKNHCTIWLTRHCGTPPGYRRERAALGAVSFLRPEHTRSGPRWGSRE